MVSLVARVINERLDFGDVGEAVIAKDGLVSLDIYYFTDELCSPISTIWSRRYSSTTGN